MASLKTSRRTFLRNGTLLTGGALTLGGLMTAAERGAAQGRATQNLTVGTNIPFTTLDPNTINTSVFPFRNSAFDPLLGIPVADIPKFQLGPIQPELASAYTVNANYTEIRLRIRDGVKFHNGKPMTANSVVESLKYTLDPATGGTVSGSLAAITNVSSQGDDVILKTSAPNVGLLYRLSLGRIQSPDFFGKAANNPVGTGPFKFVEWVPGSSLVMERFNDYWKPIPSNIKTLTYRFFTDPEAMLNAALSGDLDIMQFGSLKDAGALRAKGWTAYAAPIADYQMLVLNYTAENSVLRNVNIRQAIARAIDRKAIVKNVYFDLVEPITIPMPPSDPTYDKEIAAEWDFDLAAAAEFVKKSGISNPTFELRVQNNDAAYRRIGQIIQADLAKIGVTANITLMDPTAVVNDAIAGRFQANVYACSIGVPNVADFEDCSVYRSSKGPFSGEKTFPDYKQAYDEAAAIIDEKERIAAFKKVFKIVHNHAWAIPICMRGLLCGQQAKVSGVAYDAKTHLMYQNIVKA
jgi:peptide/nickel transport system substrate-binding protein